MTAAKFDVSWRRLYIGNAVGEVKIFNWHNGVCINELLSDASSEVTCIENAASRRRCCFVLFCFVFVFAIALYLSIYLSIYVCMYLCMYVYEYIYIYIYIYIYMLIYTSMYQHSYSLTLTHIDASKH